MGSIQIGCGQITWVRFGPNGAEWLAPEDEVLGQIVKAICAGISVARGPRTDTENPAAYMHRCLTPAVFGMNPGFIGYGFHPYGVVATHE